MARKKVVDRKIAEKRRRPKTPKTKKQAQSEILEAMRSSDADDSFGLNWNSLDPAQQQLRKNMMLNVIQLGAPRISMRALMQQTFGTTDLEADNIYRDILRTLRNDFTDDVPFVKTATVTRIKADIARMRGAKNPQTKQILAYEKFLATLEGTQAPVKIATLDVDENMRENLAQVLTTSTPARLREFIARGRELPPHE